MFFRIAAILCGTALSWLGAASAAVATRPSVTLDAQPPRGFYDAAGLTVRLGGAGVGSEIRFTLNGGVPDREAGFLYTNPIPIAETTVLRAAVVPTDAVRSEGVTASLAPVAPAITHTYVFWHDLLHQAGRGFPATWGTNLGRLVPADYEMDPEIVGHPAYRAAMRPALRALPSLFVAMDQADWFDPVRGIYANPKEVGAAWERAASLEFLPADGAPGFQVSCGIRIQGGWNRRPEESPKHSFRVVFRKKYGPGKLRYALFAEDRDGPREFDELVLRSGCNNSWLHWNGEERRRGDLLRDQWMRDTFAAMGHASARGLFVHLFLNGLYWGVYNITERPSAPFVAWHDGQGGKPEHFDVRNADDTIEGDDAGWRELLRVANAGVAGPAEYDTIGRLVDLPHLADFLIVNYYGANADWDRASNWYAARRRQPPGPYRFYIWDGERTLERVEDDTMAFDDDQSPPRLFHRLRENAAFRRLFAERARRHLTRDGALTPSAAAARYQNWSTRLDAAMVAESARWGDYRRDAHRYKQGPYELHTRDDHWRPEVTRLLTDYFPRRTDVVIQLFQKAGLWSGEY